MDGQSTFGARAKRTMTRLFVFLVVLALAGATLFLLSQLNARTYAVEKEGDELVVVKGRMLPVGRMPFRPSDPMLQDAYAPIPLEGMDPGSILDQRFTEKDELDRALFDVIERLARPRAYSDDPQKLDRALYYVRRGGKLAGITPEQRQTLKALQAEVSYYVARTRLDDARREVAEALTELRLAADSNNPHARSANQMLSEVEPAAKALEESLRRAVHTLSTPAEQAGQQQAQPSPAGDAGSALPSDGTRTEAQAPEAQGSTGATTPPSK